MRTSPAWAGRTVLEGQFRGDEPLVGHRGDDVAVADAVLGRRAQLRAPGAVDGLDAAHVRPGLPAEGAGVHGERAAQGAGNAGEELRRPQTPLDALAGDARAGDAGLGAHHGLAQALERIERAVHADDDAADAAVAHQQVAAEPDPGDRHLARAGCAGTRRGPRGRAA